MTAAGTRKRNTALTTLARERGPAVADGLEVVVHQGAGRRGTAAVTPTPARLSLCAGSFTRTRT